MDYEVLETELTDKLNAYFTANTLSALLFARIMPADDEEFSRAGEKTLINVQYSASSYAEPKGLSQIQQDETVIVSFFIQARELRGDNGAMQAMKHLKKCLLGYKPVDARTRMYISTYIDWTNVDEIKPSLEMSFETICQQEKEEDVVLGVQVKAELINAPE